MAEREYNVLSQGLLCSSSLWINRMLANITVYCLANNNKENKLLLLAITKTKTTFGFKKPQPNLI